MKILKFLGWKKQHSNKWDADEIVTDIAVFILMAAIVYAAYLSNN